MALFNWLKKIFGKRVALHLDDEGWYVVSLNGYYLTETLTKNPDKANEWFSFVTNKKNRAFTYRKIKEVTL